MEADRKTISASFRKTQVRRVIFICALLLLVLLLSVASIIIGSAGLDAGDVLTAVLAGIAPGLFSPDPMAYTIVWDLRLHRVLFAIVAGFGLAVAGAVMQGVLRNPLASPFTLGIASAASFGAALAIILLPVFVYSDTLVVVSAFSMSILAAGAIYGLSRLRGVSSESMVLAGIILMYLFGAMTSFLQYAGTTEQLQAVVFWMFGSLQRTTWEKLALVSVVVGIVTPVLVWRSWDLNALSMGDQVAQSLGVRVGQARTLNMVAASLITASIICFTGTIGFIGLVSPHITRLAIGGDHRYLIVASGFVGALILLASDSLGRTVLAPQIIPVGIMTSFIGIPFFLYLFMRRKEEYW
jgi:iron complex transport system permease protein